MHYPVYTVPETLPNWVKKGRTQFQNQHAGPAETAKDILFQFSTIGYDFDKLMEADGEFCARLTPDVIWNWTNALSDDFLDKMDSLGKNLIQVPWSVGFSTESEAIQRKVITEFTEKAHRRGIKVCAYFSLTNIFWKDAYEKEPFLKDLNARFSDGSTVLYGYSQARHIACVSNPQWLEYLAAKVESAITEGKVDAIYFDNLSANCSCKLCRQLFGDFTEKHTGKRLEAPKLEQPFPQNVKQKLEVEVELSEKEQIYSRDENHSREYLWGRFKAYKLAEALLYLREFAFKLKFPLGFSANNHLMPFINDICNIIYSQDTRFPGKDWSNIVCLRYLEGDCNGWKQQITNHPINGNDSRLSIAEAMAFQGYPYHATHYAYNRFYADNPELFSEVQNLSEMAVVLQYPRRRPYYLQPLGLQNFQYEVIVLDKWSKADFGKYKAIILPDLEAMDDELLEALKNYENRGGKAIMTGISGEFDIYGRRRKNFENLAEKVEFEDKVSNAVVSTLKKAVGEKLIEIDSENLIAANFLIKNDSKEILIHIINYSEEICGPVSIQLRNDIVFSKIKVYSPDGEQFEKASFDKNNIILEKMNIFSIIKLS